MQNREFLKALNACLHFPQTARWPSVQPEKIEYVRTLLFMALPVKVSKEDDNDLILYNRLVFWVGEDGSYYIDISLINNVLELNE